MKVLIVSPKFPNTFWSLKYVMRFIRKKAVFPPLGLLTIARMLPDKWNIRLIDMNSDKLKNKDIDWADYVFIGAMHIQLKSVKNIIQKCKKYNTKIVAGGPMFTMDYKLFIDKIDHFVLNEAEITLPTFLNDLNSGCAKQVYTSSEFANIQDTPTPLWNLINFKKYASVGIQYTRGCPFNCDFCNVTSLFGRRVRHKTSEQIINELDSIYNNGYQGPIFFVDDNFIGNIVSLKRDLLPAMIIWKKSHPGISFYTEVSINISDDPELMEMMRLAGFNQVFIGIETPNNKSLKESKKIQNHNRDLIRDIKKIQQHGLLVQAGFIVGFDSDTEEIFDNQIDFIQKSGITTAMVGLLQAFPGTGLYARMQKSNRLSSSTTGDNVDGTTNIIPTSMDIDTLLKGYKHILTQIYSPKNYYKRTKIFLKEYQNQGIKEPVNFNQTRAFLRSVLFIGFLGKERFQYWNLLFWTFFHFPKYLPMAVNLSIFGFHFRKTVKYYVKK